MNHSPSLNNHLHTWRILTFVAIVGLAFALFFVRLFTLQVLEKDKWIAKAEENSSETINLPSLRGIIYDRNGIVLARNIASYDIAITSADLPDDPGAVQEIFRELSNLIDVPINGGELSKDNPYVPCRSNHGIAQIVQYGETATPFQPVKIKCNVDESIAKVIQEKAVDWPGVSVQIQPIRDYPTGELTANVIGFLGPIPALQEKDYVAKGLQPNRDKVGYAGIELEYQDLLAGKNGTREVQIDVAGKTLNDLQPPTQAVPGYNLRLTIDTRLQQAAEAILKNELQDWNRTFGEIRYTSGVVIAINPQTGEILSMVSYPTFENNRMAREIPDYYYKQLIQDPVNPLLNHAVGDVLPAGSVFKLVTGTGALNEGVVTPDQVVETPGYIMLTEKFYQNDIGKERKFVDWIYNNGQNPGGFGHLDFVHCLANSSNVCFYKLGGGYKDEIPNGGLGICRLKTYAEALGYNQKPGTGLPDEEKGLIPDPTWKRINHSESWSTGDTYLAAVGQGYVLATPLQVLQSASIIANDGKFMQSTLIRDVLDGEGNVIQPFQPKLKWDITKDALIQEFNETTIKGCEPIEGQKKTVQPWVLQTMRTGMRLAVTEGTLKNIFDGSKINAAGKTGTAEYCDNYAQAKNRCIPGNWPSHAWTVAFAPYDKPEIAVVAFVYNGTEGSTVSGPIVRRVLESYFDLKSIDNAIQAH